MTDVFADLQGDIVHLDSASISPLPRDSLRLISDYHERYAAATNPKHFISEQTDKLINVRQVIQRLINAKSTGEIVLTRSATEAINVVASGIEWRDNDEIILTDTDHLSNIIPWRRIAQSHNLRIRYAQTTVEGRLLPSALQSVLHSKTRLVAFSHVSNIYGGIQDLSELLALLRGSDIISLIDAAQSVGRVPIDVQQGECDFLVASGRKALMGPLGTGFLYGKMDSLIRLGPLLWGTASATIDNKGLIEKRLPPKGLEANLPCLAYLFALESSSKVLLSFNIERTHKRTQGLTRILLDGLNSLSQIKIFAEQDVNKQSGIVSFAIQSQSALSVAEMLSKHRIIVGAGDFGTEFLPYRTGHDSLVRVSIHFYNTEVQIHDLLNYLSVF